MLLHASCVAFEGEAVLILGPPGSGKSDLVLRLIQDPAWHLVGDDQVELTAEPGGLRARAPAALQGMLEVRGLGLFTGMPVASDGPGPTVRLVLHLAPREDVPRLPEPALWHCAGTSVPAVTLHGLDASAPAKVALALAAATGRATQAAGAPGTGR
jgi:serine kinase of HPr protein (carbohydrate metabolism regulator)